MYVSLRGVGTEFTEEWVFNRFLVIFQYFQHCLIFSENLIFFEFVTDFSEISRDWTYETS